MQAIHQEQYIEIGIAAEMYALKIYDIHEIIRMQQITEIPNCREYVKGVINLRGKIIPIISLRSLFGLQEEPYTKMTRIVVVHHMEDTVGIVVDYVSKVTMFSDILPTPDRVGGISGHYFVGIGVAGESLVGILKLDRVLIKEQEG